VRLGRQTLDRHRLVEPLGGPGQQRCERVGLGLAHRGPHELGLTAVTVRRDDHPAGGGGGGARAEGAPHQVQRGIDASGGSSTGEDVAVEDIENVRRDAGLREGLGEAVGVPPVRGAVAAVEQAGVTEQPRCGAVGRDDGAPIGGLAHGLDHAGMVVREVALRDDAHQIGRLERLEPVLDEQVESGRSLDAARLGGAHGEVEDGVVVLRMVGLGPDLTDGTKAERFGSVLHDHGDVLHAS
jgi:hypothetical protein